MPPAWRAPSCDGRRASRTRCRHHHDEVKPAHRRRGDDRLRREKAPEDESNQTKRSALLRVKPSSPLLDEIRTVRLTRNIALCHELFAHSDQRNETTGVLRSLPRSHDEVRRGNLEGALHERDTVCRDHRHSPRIQAIGLTSHGFELHFRQFRLARLRL